MNDKRQILKYILSDFTGSFIGWFLFNIFRYHIVGYLTMPSLSSFLTFRTVVEGQIISPFMWVFLFFLSGYYNRPFLKSRFEELKTTLSSVFLGTLFVFFIVVLDDMPLNPSSYIDIMAGLFLIEFFFVYILRYTITTRATHKIHGARLGYNTVIIGTGKNANKFRKESLDRKSDA